MSGVVHVWCGGCPFFTHSVVDVWCGGSPVWWISGVVDVLFYPWCGGCLVWWMSSVVDVCVVDVGQSTRPAQLLFISIERKWKENSLLYNISSFSGECSEDAVAQLQKQDTLKISFETVLQEGSQKR